jgi:hypothetical protein
MAECLGLYWDDLNATQYEIDTFKKTLLGQAVDSFDRFASKIPVPKQPRAPRSTTAGTGSVPNNTYKSSGPQSANIRDLHGTAGVKVYAQNTEVYRIIGTNSASKNIPTVFVKPLSPSGNLNGTNKVFVSSGNGYTDCACWFDDLNAAQDFLSKVLANASITNNISNLHIVRNKPDSNGYFLVGTEFGECAISAKKLNEALVETTDEAELMEQTELEEDNGWERVGKRITKEEFDALSQSMLKY